MKKFIFFMILFCTVFSVHSQITSSNKEDTLEISYTRFKEHVDQIPSSIPDSAKVTFSHIYNDMKESISGIASALKIGANHVYEILVQQQIVKSFIGLICITIGFIICSILLVRYKSHKEKWFEDHGREVEVTFLGYARLIQWLIGALLFLIGLFMIPKIITGFINPEYGAIIEIMKFVKK